MPATYEPIATTTLGSAAADITFSSIPSTYTDLKIIFVATASAIAYGRMQFNSDANTNYSRTQLYGEGTNAYSSRNTNQTYIQLSINTEIQTDKPALYTIDIFNYAGSTNKTFLIQQSNDNNGSGTVSSTVGLWRDTSAITSVKLYLSANNLAAGTTATLYGILKA